MAAIITAPAPRRALPAPRWALPLMAVAVALLWLVTMEGAAVSQAIAGAPAFLHELFHDGRHLLGVPCH
ncbi:MAG: CbtB-domain containing protein [Actinomycetota bacterium]|jgi:hypothetical protein